ncbi:MAG: hypothetical protein HYZ13_13325 [Acidobacteria bacterium]|nr:hypothetical protein [Acidobacteriota bacterium]
MTRSTIIGAGLAVALLLTILVMAGGSSAPKAAPAPRTLEEAPLQKVAFMTDPAAAKAAAKSEQQPTPAHH